MSTLQVRMLGEFSISTEEKQLSDSDNRSRKVWTLLAYLIYHRHRVITQDELMTLLWEDASDSTNPGGALKTIFHRARATLDRLWPGAGHELILRRGGGYTWNDEIPLTLDTELFDRLCQTEDLSDRQQLAQALEALALYQGDFLDRMSAEPWIIPISVYYHNGYVQTLLKVLPQLIASGRCDEVVALCQTAALVEPYHEQICAYRMRALLQLGEQKQVMGIYTEFSDQLFANFGVLPSDELRALYFDAANNISDSSLPIELVCEQLKEINPPDGAMICEYDFFRIVCRSVARSIARTGITVHIALFTVSDSDGGDLPKRSLQRVMENLETLIRTNLRRGDAATRCSVSQYILMLPQANYENSCKVCERIVRAFYRKYPHSPAVIQYTVQPLNPSI
ncbi:MAG: winged helix-turn-helix domain-containing protein [Clostridia bacterium]|nr:winged helix-turn-helix domain-containing protein [Clostridia bacterium]